MECGVCFNDFKIDGLNRPMTIVPCGHALCYECCPKIANCPECTLPIEKAIPNRLVLEYINLKEEHTLMKSYARAEAPKTIQVYLMRITGETLAFRGSSKTRCIDLKDYVIRSWNRNVDEIRFLVHNRKVLADDDTFEKVNIKDEDLIRVVFYG